MKVQVKSGWTVMSLLVLGGLVTGTQAQEEPVPTAQGEEVLIAKGKKGGIGFGFLYVSFDTSLRFTDKTKESLLGGRNQEVFVDMEGTFGLPRSDKVPMVYGIYRFSHRHAIGFSYWQVKRETTLFAFDMNLDDLLIVQGEATLGDRTRFYNLNYSHTFFDDGRGRVLGQIGINGMDFRYSLAARGQLVLFPGLADETQTAEYREDDDVFAPLPLFGVDLQYNLTPRWSVTTAISLVGGTYQDTSAGVLSTRIVTNYQFSRTWGVLFGLGYFDADVTIEDSKKKTEVLYSYTGAAIGFHALF